MYFIDEKVINTLFSHKYSLFEVVLIIHLNFLIVNKF